MRRIQFAMHLLIATITLVAAGCRQTSPTSASGALVPLSPGTGSAAPTFQPFGGQTRVTPPPAHSFSQPNNYLGGTTPVGQMVNPSAAVGGLAAVQNPAPYGPTSAGPGVIGSGVQQTGWTETGASVAQPINPNSGAYGPGAVAPGGMAAGPIVPQRDPRSGGMQVIDLTGAPVPPGYRPNFVPQTGFVTPSISQRDFSQPPSFAPIRSVQAPQTNNFASANPAPASAIAAVPQFQPRQAAGGQPMAGAYPAATGGNLTPTHAAPALGNAPPATAAQPSNLPWRSPGTQY
jgi:hypothetical protein